MAFVNELLLTSGFTSVDSISITHNLDRLNLDYRVIIDSVSRPDLVRDLVFTRGNERNEFVIRLNSTESGVVQILDDNKYPTNLPTPENALKLVSLPQPDDIPNTFVTGGTLNSTTLELKRNEGLSDIDVDLSSIDGTVTSVGGTGNVNGITLGGTVTDSGNLTLGGTLSINDGDWSGTDLSIANGGTGQSDVQDAINALTQVSSATNEHVLTKDTSTGNATWKAAGGTDKFVSGGTYSEPTTAEPKISFVGNSSETTFNVLTNVFGTYYDYAESLAEQDNSTTTYSTALSITTDTVPDGVYRIGWSYEWRGNTRDDFDARVQVDGSTVMDVNMEAKDNNSYHGVGGFANQTFGSNGTHTINFDFRSESNGDIMRLRNLRLEFYRVSSVSG